MNGLDPQSTNWGESDQYLYSLVGFSRKQHWSKLVEASETYMHYHPPALNGPDQAISFYETALARHNNRTLSCLR
jgi:hypothetical protein